MKTQSPGNRITMDKLRGIYGKFDNDGAKVAALYRLLGYQAKRNKKMKLEEQARTSILAEMEDRREAIKSSGPPDLFKRIDRACAINRKLRVTSVGEQTQALFACEDIKEQIYKVVEQRPDENRLSDWVLMEWDDDNAVYKAPGEVLEALTLLKTK